MWVYTCCLLLVSTYLYRYVFLCSVVFCVGSAQHHPEGKGTPNPPAQIHNCGLKDLHTYKTAYTQHLKFTLTHTVNTEELLWAANKEEDQVKWDLSRTPITTSLYGTQWMVELNMSRHMSCLFARV